MIYMFLTNNPSSGGYKFVEFVLFYIKKAFFWPCAMKFGFSAIVVVLDWLRNQYQLKFNL